MLDGKGQRGKREDFFRDGRSQERRMLFRSMSFVFPGFVFRCENIRLTVLPLADRIQIFNLQLSTIKLSNPFNLHAGRKAGYSCNQQSV